MDISAEQVILAFVFVAVVLGVEAASLLLRGRGKRETAVNRRMKFAARRNEDVLNPELFREKVEGGPLSALFSSVIPGFNRLIWRAQVGVTPSQVAIIMLGAMLFLFLILSAVMDASILIPLVLAVVLGFGGPYVFLGMKASSRQRKFDLQLPTGIDIMVRGLQAGYPAPVAMEMVAREMEDPIGSEFGVALDEMNYGLERSVALRNISTRFPSPELKFLVSTIEMQRETGGNLAEVLSNLSKVIRERATMKKKIWAISAEGRISCYVVGGLPFLLVLAIMGLNPAFFTEVASDPFFAPMIGGGFFMWLIGISWIWRMVNFKF
jgi:tight adherence protein B